ncbi:hypothetical protein [Streptomyces sp. NPDC003077]|uniref:hypothetical protein n=1 Tax=Streptomyces sp. NPDC003077 TaxID=3154443 RepID=UPI0033AD0C59
MTPTMATPRRAPRRTALLLAALATTATAALTTGCGGPGGVELGTDWKGAQTFALAKVSGLVTVVGINPGKATAESLVAVPTQEDDDEVISPQITELADGRRLLSVPRKDGKPDRLYEVNRKDHTLDGKGDTEGLRDLVPGKTRIAAVAGLPGKRQGGSGGDTSVLIRDAANRTTQREAKIPGTITLTASDPAASDKVCLGARSGSGTTVTVLDLTDGATRTITAPSGADVQELACPNGHPVLAGTHKPAGSGALKVTLERHADHSVLTAQGGRVDGVAATGNSVVAAIATAGHTELVELDATTGRELHRTKLPDLPDSLGIRHTPSGWLVFTEKTVTRVDLTSGKSKTFDLPGELLDF